MGESQSTKEQITATNLSVTYLPGQSNEVKSLDNINLSIYEGEFIIFFGPSGCGKSTLLYSIANLEKFRGSIVVEGKKISELVKKDKVSYSRDSIGMVFQAYHLIPTLSVVQNVELPLISAGIKKSERRARAMELLTRFGVNNQAYKLPNELSGGQQQRVAICRAVINNPKIILADEPLGNLDSKSADEVIKLFKDINERFKKTIILVTHDPTYLDIAHRIFFIKDGKLIDTKVNKDIKDSLHTQNNFGTSNHAKEIDFLSNHYPKTKTVESDYLIRSYQAKNIATLALTGFSSDDLDALRGKIESSLKNKDDFKEVMEFLDVEPPVGGLGLDRQTAEKITNHIRVLARELLAASNFPIDDEDKYGPEQSPEQKKKEKIVKLRKSLFDELNIKLKHFESLGVIDEAILNRVDGKIDRKELYLKLDKPLADGGAGLDKRMVNRIVKRLEVWLIGQKE